MAIQYPSFTADPNSVPKINGLPGLIDSVQKGYQLSQLPDQLKMQQQLQAAKLQQAQQQSYYYPKQQEAELQGKLLQNQYYPQMQNAQLAQDAAQTGYLNSQRQYYPSLINSEIAKNNAEAAKAGQSQNGIAITGYDEQGRPIIQIGGSGGTSSRNGGRLGTDANGNINSELTNANKTAVQNRKIGDDIVKPFIDQIISNVPQFQTYGKQAQTQASSIANKFGISADIMKNIGLDASLPSQQAAGQAAIATSTEGLIKALGLRPTDQQTAMIQRAIAPQPGESKDAYTKRILDFANTLSQNSKNAQQLLATGINTGVNVNGQQNNYAQSQQVGTPNPDYAHMTDAQLAQIANGGQ